jgi:hypothetical protein
MLASRCWGREAILNDVRNAVVDMVQTREKSLTGGTVRRVDSCESRGGVEAVTWRNVPLRSFGTVEKLLHLGFGHHRPDTAHAGSPRAGD